MSQIVLPPHITEQVEEIMAPLLNPERWRDFGLSFAKQPFAIVRMEGAPGTGKTALSNHMARKFRRPPIHVSFAGVASPQLGETEKKIITAFEAAHETECPCVILEECDAVLWSRDLVDRDSMYQLGFVNTFLHEIDKFVTRQIPSLLILTTNYPKLLDPALVRRITDVIELSPPVGNVAMKMWKQKLPASIYGSMTSEEWKKLLELKVTPDQMEKAVLRLCRKSIVNCRTPEFSDFGI